MPGWEMIVYDGIGPRIEQLIFKTEAEAQAAFELGARRVEEMAKANAPWEDRTGEARAGLTAEVFDDAGELVLELYHTAEHGYWLELIQDGRFAIIMPTLEQVGPEILRAAGAAAIGIGLSE